MIFLREGCTNQNPEKGSSSPCRAGLSIAGNPNSFDSLVWWGPYSGIIVVVVVVPRPIESWSYLGSKLNYSRLSASCSRREEAFVRNKKKFLAKLNLSFGPIVR